MHTYFSHSYRDVAVNAHFLDLFLEEEVELQADQKTDVWCIAKLERYMNETAGFVSIIPRRETEKDPGGYSPYIGHRGFGRAVEASPRPVRETVPGRAAVVAIGGRALRAAAQDVGEILRRAGFSVALLTEPRPGHGLDRSARRAARSCTSSAPRTSILSTRACA